MVIIFRDLGPLSMIFLMWFYPTPSLIQGLPRLGVRFHPFQTPGRRCQVGISRHRDDGVGAQGGIDPASKSWALGRFRPWRKENQGFFGFFLPCQVDLFSRPPPSSFLNRELQISVGTAAVEVRQCPCQRECHI